LLIKHNALQLCHTTNPQSSSKLEIWGKAQHKWARRPKSDYQKIQAGGRGEAGDKISPVAKSRGLKSNALAHAERALTIYGR